MIGRRHIKRTTGHGPNTATGWKFGIALVTVLIISMLWAMMSGEDSSAEIVLQHAAPTQIRSSSQSLISRYRFQGVKVFSASVDNNPIAEKQRQDLSAPGSQVQYMAHNVDEQRAFIQMHSDACSIPGGNNALHRYNQLMESSREHLAQELWKYCALYVHGGVYIDATSPLLISIGDLLSRHGNRNIAVLNEAAFEASMHGSLLYLQKSQSKIAAGMLQVLMETSMTVMDASPLLLPRTQYDLILQDVGADSGSLSVGANRNDWWILQQHCHVDPLRRTTSERVSRYALDSYRLSQHCPEASGFCCHIYDISTHSVVMMTRHPVLPYQAVPLVSQLPKPYNAEAGHYEEENLPYIATIRERIIPRPDVELPTPNFFEILLQNDCLPSDNDCSTCLREKKGADCTTCLKACPCYCKTLCHVPVDEKFVSKELTVTPPVYSRDPARLVPRIVHQTWFEEVTKEKYPNMSRLIESFRQSGWEYRFYTDDEAANFLSTHFPAEIREAYDALRPGAFKADLFRYCVLLIKGGIYADMDIMLESNLDLAVAPDIGFMVPVDEPGAPVNRRMCVWNGFIAAAPAHPFLARVVETVVNNVRNRFTSVDNDNLFCPNPELSVLHAFDTLFTAGPCILGGTINKVLGRHGQTQFEAGELFPTDPSTKLPGRTIILHQDKWDMGAHRFTFLEQNLVVAATDLPDSDDRENLEGNEHYSKTHVKTGIYGLEKLYTDNHRANEELRFTIAS